MSDTTPTPQRSEEPTPLADETAAALRTGAQPTIPAGGDPADHTDTATVQPLDPGYRPVAASEHVAPEQSVPQTSDEVEPTAEPADSEASAQEAPAETAATDAPAAAPVSEPVTQAATTTESAPAAEAPATPTTVEPTAAEQPAPAASVSQPSPVYVQPPTPPKKRSNRGVGILLAVLATVLFAALEIAATYVILFVRFGADSTREYILSYVEGWEFWLPLAVFAAAFIALVAIVNRGRWWAYVFGSMFVAALVFVGYFAAALITNRIWERTPDEFRSFLGDYFQANVPYVLIAFTATFLALEVVTWMGAWIAARGQSVKRRNAEAAAAYEEERAALAR
ncbi:ABC transporter permease family protein [Gryllotalpicola ginsengisoli]|uniref:hypothetical protein n=1 Tax=Gryllotalpicola ginsengisoli TaxID=444608 RepID=UPI0003B59753|nr:hypothetical protein [Gryllotalpicola ginsengisoli]